MSIYGNPLSPMTPEGVVITFMLGLVLYLVLLKEGKK